MIIEKYDWKFNVDIQKTQSMYGNRVKSEIYAQSQLTELVNFLNELGIDIEKPDEYNSDLSDVVYTFIGSAESETNYEIDMYGKERFISIVIYNNNGSVMLEVFGMN
ncbi:hypothetical protein SDC9_183296 [bioreactor metagenome]|uniref:Uncharacterized protein n=1 Tax=bioreactor metagenome TaxID=1076179 RepID=A0A645HI47_9ZZZZ